jgi:ribosome modulation factor
MEQDADSPSPAFTEGYESGRTGDAHTANPHPADSLDSEQWLKGWGEGATKRTVVNAKPDPATPTNG